jgi:hypothetical protein
VKTQKRLEVEKPLTQSCLAKGRAVRLVGVIVIAGLALLSIVGLTGQTDVALAVEVAPEKWTDTSATTRVVDDPTIFMTYLPLVMKNYDPTPVPFAVQMYGNITTSMGFTWAVAAGAGWIRFPVSWAGIEPNNTDPSKYSWTLVDNSIQTILDAGLVPIVTIENNPGWAAATSCGPVTDTVDLHEFVGALVARYPRVIYWEFYNEPDRVGNCYGGNGSGYAAMLRAVYPIVKAANPNANVVMGGLAMDWFVEDGGPFDSGFLTNVLSSCTDTCFDVANFHYYPGFRQRWEPFGRDIVGKATRMRQILMSYGYNRPLINTETGWPAGTVTGSPELAARYVPKVYVRARAAGLLATTWFALTDADTSSPGLLGPGLVPRPSFTAYQVMAAFMSQARYVRTIPATETGSQQIEAYQFTVPHEAGFKRLDVYWYDCPSLVSAIPTDCSTVVPLSIAAARVGLIGKLGTRAVLTDGDDGQIDGRISIPGSLGSSPIYIDYQP